MWPLRFDLVHVVGRPRRGLGGHRSTIGEPLAGGLVERAPARFERVVLRHAAVHLPWHLDHRPSAVPEMELNTAWKGMLDTIFEIFFY